MKMVFDNGKLEISNVDDDAGRLDLFVCGISEMNMHELQHFGISNV
jgi:hypothetical protein